MSTSKKQMAKANGRPTKYTQEMCDKVLEYLELKKDSQREGGRLEVKLPTVEGFAVFIGVNKTTLYEWEKAHDEFSNALDLIRTEQQERLLNSGLSGAYNSTIAKLILSSNHGMTEKSTTDVTSKGEKIEGFTIEFIKPNATTDKDS